MYNNDDNYLFNLILNLNWILEETFKENNDLVESRKFKKIQKISTN